MALNAYLTLEGETQGPVAGSVTQGGREDSIMVIGYSHKIVSPRDAASGLPTGKRQHGPLVITKEIDKASPLLQSIICNNENIIKFEINFWAPSITGQETVFYKIELENASISEIHQEMLNNKYPENMQHKEREHISFCYQKIIWTFEDGGITAEDDWEAPLV